MTFPETPAAATATNVAITEELAAIVRNARLLGVPAWRVATALDISVDQFAQVRALVPGDGTATHGN